jgi:hypothetical protein
LCSAEASLAPGDTKRTVGAGGCGALAVDILVVEAAVAPGGAVDDVARGTGTRVLRIGPCDVERTVIRMLGRCHADVVVGFTTT